MDGIFTMERLPEPEWLDDNIKIEVVITGQVALPAATASRSLLDMLQQMLTDES